MSFIELIVQDTGSNVGKRRKINLIEGSNVTITVADDAANDRVNITIASTGGGGVSDGDKGDIIVSSGGTQWDIDTAIDLSVNSLTTTTSVEATSEVVTPIVRATGSAGVMIHNTSGQDCALFGAGGGQNVTLYDGVKLDAGTASAVLLTDSSKNIAYITLGAGQSVRRNAGNTAYEAFTPSSGGLTQEQVEGLI